MEWEGNRCGEVGSSPTPGGPVGLRRGLGFGLRAERGHVGFSIGSNCRVCMSGRQQPAVEETEGHRKAGGWGGGCRNRTDGKDDLRLEPGQRGQ